jgi:hypothetical protein
LHYPAHILPRLPAKAQNRLMVTRRYRENSDSSRNLMPFVCILNSFVRREL